MLIIDFETYSEVNIEKKGGVAYSRHPSTQLICMAYRFSDMPAAELITPASPLLPYEIGRHIESGGIVVAHNAAFDYRIWNQVCVPNFRWPELKLEQMLDSMALCQTFSIPASLANAGEALGIKMKKSVRGKQLIKLCCVPTKDGVQPTPWGRNSAAFKELYEYCKRDVDAVHEVLSTLPRQSLLPKEQDIWRLNYDMNTHGLPCDYHTAQKIKAYIEKYIDQEVQQLPKLCGGAFESVNQIAKIKEWCRVQGYPLKALDAEAVSTAIADETCPPNVRKILELRQELGRSSTAKYKKLLDLATRGEDGNWYLHDNLQYHGATTGRWAGRGFQVHNLPRASVKDPEAYIESFMNGKTVENPVFVAKALIRPMIKAPEGSMLLISDYKGIENRVLHWLAGDTAAIDDFNNGVDQYKVMASARYQVHYDEVTKSQRQMGKVIILGAGFGMGWAKFVETAWLQFGLRVSDDEAKAAIKAYREKYSQVPALWYGLQKAMVACISQGKRTSYGRINFGIAKVKGIVWLGMQLPSGKCVYYMEPGVGSDYIPGYESMGKVPVVTHMGTNPHSKKWSRMRLIPGRITENCVQGTAREVMAQGLLNVRDRMPWVKLLATVHDEAITLIKIDDISDNTVEYFNELLCDISWADGCPLGAEGFISKRYKKE